MTNYWLALALTIVVESVIAYSFCRRQGATESWYWWPLAIVGLNLCSHPIAWTAISSLQASFLATEMAVVIAEMLGLRLVATDSLARAASTSVAMNVASTALGCLL